MSSDVLLSVVIVASALPGTWLQAMRVARRQTTVGLSSTYFLVGLISAMAWAVYGLLMHHETQVFTNGSAVVATMIVAIFMWRLRTLSWSSVGVALVCLCAISAAGVVGGALSIGLVASALDVGGRLPQAWKALREPGGEGVSIANFAINATNAVAWVAYGVMNADLLIAASSLYCLAMNVLIVWRTYNAREIARTSTLVAV